MVPLVPLVPLGSHSQRKRAAPTEAVEAAEALEVTVALDVLTTQTCTRAQQVRMALPKRHVAAHRKQMAELMVPLVPLGAHSQRQRTAPMEAEEAGEVTVALE